MRLLGISGSLRRDSHNTRLLKTATRHLPGHVELELWDGLREIPPYDADRDAEEPTPRAVADLKRAIDGADAVLIATPEYNASIPGQLKNALDWVSRPFETNPLRGKPAAVVGATTGMFGAVWAQAEARKVLRTIGADVVESEVPVAHAHEAFHDDGALRDAVLVAQLEKLLEELVARTGARVAA
jgi:chromate reductase, NAD(P)H dehydrogenase (quinone)